MKLSIRCLLSLFMPILLAVSLGGCFEEDAPVSGGLPSDLAAICEADQVVTEDYGEGIYGTCVDAVFRDSGEDPLPDPEDDEKWVYLKFMVEGETATIADVSAATLEGDPDDSDAWDIAIQRSNIKLNGGANGTGTVAAAGLFLDGSVDLETHDAPPFMSLSEWHEDWEVGTEEEFETAYVLTNLPGDEENCDFGWYHYGGCEGNHGVLTARDGVAYALLTMESDYIALHVTGWQNQAGTSGYLHFFWKVLEEPQPPCADENAVTHTVNADSSLTTCVDASDTEAWQYFDLATGSVVTPATPEDSDEWDLAFRRNSIKVNGGASGSEDVAVAVFEEAAADFDSIAVAPVEGDGEGEYEYYTDVDGGEDPDALVFGTYPEYEGEPPFIGLGWILYNPAGGHTLAARDVVYVVRSVEGVYYKFQFASYYKNTTTLQGGSSGFVSFRWSGIDAPAEPE